ncbi:MAG TPA: NIL domain-containing protein [Methanomassiliicoccales archaeon]|nr:NIL domain-containing protein [Methanomassiliicoccales archaeon]
MLKKYLLTFDPDQVSEPITFRIVKDFDLMVNILRAEIDEHGGRLMLGLEGSGPQIQKAVKYLEEAGVQVQELKEYIRKDDARCTNCGMCVSVCPVSAYQVDKNTWKVVFHNEKCIACGMCIDACPPGAIKLRAQT